MELGPDAPKSETMRLSAPELGPEPGPFLPPLPSSRPLEAASNELDPDMSEDMFMLDTSGSAMPPAFFATILTGVRTFCRAFFGLTRCSLKEIFSPPAPPPAMSKSVGSFFSAVVVYVEIAQ